MNSAAGARAGKSLLAAAILAAVVLAGLSLTGPAHAQNDEARARELFAEGRQDVARGDMKAACDKFSRSHALAPDAVGPLLNLADCDERGGRVATGWRRFGRAAELADDEEQRAYAQRRAKALADRVPWLTLELPPKAPAEITIERDGEPVAAAELGEERAVDPGRYRFVVRAPGHDDAVHAIDLREGERLELVLELGPVPAPPISPDAPPPTPPPTVLPAPPLPVPDTAPPPRRAGSMAIAGWVIGGIGAAAATVGIATGIAVAVNAGIYDEHCDAEDRCDEEGLAAAERGAPLAIVSPVMLSVGIVGLGVALPLLLIDDDDTSVQVAFGPRGATLSGAF